MTTYSRLLAGLCLVSIVSMVMGLQRHVYGRSEVCDTLTTIGNRMLIRSVEADSQSDCLRHCAFDISCIDAVLLRETSSDSFLCLLLAFKRDETVEWMQTDTCFIIQMTLCHNGGEFIDGHCRCPSDYKGIYCELPNEARCSEARQLIHHGYGTSDVSYSFPVNGLSTLDDLRVMDFKVSVDSLLPNHISIGVSNEKTKHEFWGAQAIDGLTIEESADGVVFANTPMEESHIVTSVGKLSVLKFDLNGIQSAVFNYHGNNKVYSRPSPGYVAMDSTTGSINDVIQVIKNGYEPITVMRTVMYNSSTGELVAKNGKQSWATKSPVDFFLPIYLFIQAFDANTGLYQIYRRKFLDTDEYVQQPGTTSWIFDPCWYSASYDTLYPNAMTSVHLQSALRGGHRVRVVYQGVSSKVKAVYLTRNNHVIFEISPYVSPKSDFTMDSNSRMVRTLVSTSGRVKSCWNVMRQSASTKHEDYVIGSDEMEWFVDSRTWELAYTTDMAGKRLSGDLSVLKAAVTEGADVNLVLVMDSGYVEQMSMLADWVHVGQDALTAEVRSVVMVTISDSDFRFISPSHCFLEQYLISTNRGVDVLLYIYGTSGQSYDGRPMSGTVLWFLSR